MVDLGGNLGRRGRALAWLLVPALAALPACGASGGRTAGPEVEYHLALTADTGPGPHLSGASALLLGPGTWQISESPSVLPRGATSLPLPYNSSVIRIRKGDVVTFSVTGGNRELDLSCSITVDGRVASATHGKSGCAISTRVK